MIAKLFSETENGLPVHWEIDGDNILGLTNEVSLLLQWLDANGFQAHVGFGAARPATRPVAPQNGNHAEDDVPFEDKPREATAGVVRACAYCNGKVWDNRKDKRSEKAPDFKCRDKECGAAAWLQKDGGLKWSNPL